MHTRQLAGVALGALELFGVPQSYALDLQLGARLREQIESISDDALGNGGRADAIAQHRVLAYLALRPHDGVRMFIELGAYAQNGRNAGSSPVDESAPDLHQGFVEWRPGAEALRLSAGRLEWTLGSGRLVSVRDGPNIRRAFDGAELETGFGAATARAFWGRPVQNRDGAFDDRADPGQRLAGAQVEWPLADGLNLDLYVLDSIRDAARFSTGSGDEDRLSWGARLHGQQGRLAFNTEVVRQTGRWRGERIRAWTLANDFGWQLPDHWHGPRIGLKADLASGDSDPGDGRLETFNALYPNPSYFSDAALITPANLIDLQPNLSLSLSPALSASLGWNLLWKHRAADAVYTAPVPLAPVPGSAGRGGFIGQQFQLASAWAATERFRVEASYVHFEPGGALSGLQDKPIDFLQLVFTWTAEPA